jgi:hypothetical protein
MPLSTTFTVKFAIACCLAIESGLVTQHETVVASLHESVVPQWHTDLRSAIKSAPLGPFFAGEGEYKALPHLSLWFTDNDTIVATFVTQESNPSLSSRASSNTNPSLRLLPVFLNAVTGKIIATPEWSSGSRNAGIIAAHDGRFVTQAGNELTLYMANLTPLKKAILPSLAEGDWIAYPSPTGKNILFLQSGHRTGSWLWLETETLQILHSWEDTQNGDVAVTDDKIAMVTCTWSHNCEPSLQIKSIGTDWKTIGLGHRKSYPQFVNQDMLLVSGLPTKLIRADGETVFVESGSVGCGSNATPSTSGQRFVVPVCAIKGAITGLDIGGHQVLRQVLLYDAPFRGRSYTLDVKGSPIKDQTLFALSPDGLQLAILNDESVEVLKLPPLQ